MQEHRGRPKKSEGKGGVPHPHIGGMETLGPKSVGGVTYKHQGGDGKKRHAGSKSAGHHALGFGKGVKMHEGVGGLNKHKS